MNDQVWLEGINQDIQKRLAQSTVRARQVAVRSRPDLTLAIIVDGTVFQDLADIKDVALRNLIQTAIDEWQAEGASTAANHTPLPIWRPAPFNLGRKWVIGGLIAMILVFVIPAVCITPPIVGLTLSFLAMGSIIGGFIGIWGGKEVGKQVGHKLNNPGCLMSGGIFGALAGLILGGILTAFLLNLLVPM